MPWWSRRKPAQQESSSHGAKEHGSDDEQQPADSSHGAKEHGSDDEQQPAEEEETTQAKSVVVGPGQGSSHGSEETLLRIPGAIVHLIDGEESAHLATGDFCLVRLEQDGNGIVVLAKVGEDLQWPVTKDAPTAKLDETHYFFTLLNAPQAADDSAEESVRGEEGPSKLSYGVTFADNGEKASQAELDKLLEQYSLFSMPQVVKEESEENAGKEKKGCLEGIKKLLFGKRKPPAKPISIPETAKQTEVPDSISGPEEKEKYVVGKSSAYWTALAPNVDDYSTFMARGIATQSNVLFKGLFWCSDATIQQLERIGDYAKAHISTKEKPTQISPRTMRNLRRVKQMSQMSERVAKGVLAGIITATGLASGAVMGSRAGKKFFKMLPGEVALVSLDVFGKVFDAVEVAGRSVLNSTSVIACDVVSHRYGEQAAAAAHEGLSTAGHVFSIAWTISKIRKVLNPNRTPSKFSKKGVMKSVLKGKGKPEATA